MDMARSVMILFFHICVHDSSVWDPKCLGSSWEGMLICFFLQRKVLSLGEREGGKRKFHTSHYLSPLVLLFIRENA